MLWPPLWQVRGPIVLQRYYKAPQPAVDAEGWYNTGDVASIDAHGMMRIQITNNTHRTM